MGCVKTRICVGVDVQVLMSLVLDPPVFCICAFWFLSFVYFLYNFAQEENQERVSFYISEEVSSDPPKDTWKYILFVCKAPISAVSSSISTG